MRLGFPTPGHISGLFPSCGDLRSLAGPKRNIVRFPRARNGHMATIALARIHTHAYDATLEQL
jgi:hypothetical protein